MNCIPVPPRVEFTPSSVVAKIRDRVTLTCIAFGYPAPQLTMSLPKGKTYRVKATSPLGAHKEVKVKIGFDANKGGTYSCQASNSLGVFNSTSVIEGRFYWNIVFKY